MYRKNAWENLTKDELKEVMSFNEDYKAFLSGGKTERMVVNESLTLLEEKGFVCLDDLIKEKKELKAGMKVYSINKDKNIIAFVIGKKSLTEGIRVLGAHIDSPRLDIKQNPLYEKNGFALLDTHYYGGIKKYQWVATALSLVGVVCKKDGTCVEINIGDNPNDPVLGISDLLIHLSADQMKKTGAKVVEGEDLDLTVGNMPKFKNNKDDEDIKNPVKTAILDLLKEFYDIDEEDFISAEIEVVPAGPARDYGLDRSMVAGYGHDDRVCAYTSLRALLDIECPEYTSCTVLVDKEEVGSIGATGAQSLYFQNTILELLGLEGKADILTLRRTLTNIKMLSSDVSAGFDPLYPSVNDDKNAAFLGDGVVFNKYTGARGKSGCNDAMPEYVAWLRNIMDNENICYQTAELGRVDQGGGGTIAYILGNYNMNVIDAGVPVLNMHSPMEIVSKVDVYGAYLAYKAFLTK